MTHHAHSASFPIANDEPLCTTQVLRPSREEYGYDIICDLNEGVAKRCFDVMTQNGESDAWI